MAAGAELEGRDLEDAQALLENIQWFTQAMISRYLESHPQKGTRLHKSLLNRPMEWALWHTVICTSTEWQNFFKLRCHPDAQPEMRAVAEAMREARDQSNPHQLEAGKWHMPYIRESDYNTKDINSFDELKKISAGRCARVSYLTHDGIRDPAKDIELYDRLVTSGHASPLEHVATPCPIAIADQMNHHHLGNFRGWDQLRHQAIGF